MEDDDFEDSYYAQTAATDYNNIDPEDLKRNKVRRSILQGIENRAGRTKLISPPVESKPVEPPAKRFIPDIQKLPDDINLNVTFKRQRPEVDHHLDDKNITYQITKYIDNNRDLYFIKLVSGALKRRSFRSLINVESEIENENKLDVKVKYEYNTELLHGWSTVIEKVKDMIDPVIATSDRAWTDSSALYQRILEKDTLLLAFARYVAFIIMTESNNLVPRNRTRYVLDDQLRIENQRALDLMRAVKKDLGILRADLDRRYVSGTGHI